MDKATGEKLLKDAVLGNDLQKIEEIISKLDRQDFTSTGVEDLLSNELCSAVQHSSLDTVKLLVKKGASVNHKDVLKQSVLFKAVHSMSSDSENILKFLLENGANINHKNRNGQTDFMHLMYSGKLEYSYLLEKVETVSNIQEKELRTGGSYLHIASKRHADDSRVDMLKKLLEMGLDVNCLDNNDDTPLHVIGEIACHRSIQFLLENCADIKAKNSLGETVLHYLACTSQFERFTTSLKLLIDKGAEINELDYEGKTVVHHALTSGDTTCEVIKELMKYGIKMNVQDHRGQNEIFHAVEKVKDFELRSEIIKMLVEEGVDVNQANVYGVTPLHQATTIGDLDILVTILELGADVTRKSNRGATALHWACRIYNMAHVIIFWYLKNGHNINVRDNYGSTALHWAVWHRKLPVCQTLLRARCDVCIKDHNDESPTDLAQILHFPQFQELLSKFKTLKPLQLQNPVLVCNENDPLFCCPLLKYIRKEHGTVDIDEYIKHVDKHKTSLCKSINIMLKLTNMGMFYDIEDNSIVPEKMDKLMHLVADRMAVRNPLFRCELRLAGSSFEGTKVQVRDEFDFIWGLIEFSNAFVPVESTAFPEGFVKLRLRDEKFQQQFSQYLDQDNFLDCKMLNRQLYNLINEEVRHIVDDQNELICVKFLDEIFCGTSNLSFVYFGRKAKTFKIDVDVVPTIWFPEWTPEGFSVGHSCLLQQCTNDPMFSVVFKTPDRYHVKDYTMFYRISYSYLEQNIMKSVPDHIKKGYIILKSLSETGYFPKVVDHDSGRKLKKYITSYHLKTCFLHELEIAKRENDPNLKETAENVGNSISLKWAERILGHMDKCIQSGCLPSFFNPDKNVLFVEGLVVDGKVEPDVFMPLVSLFKYLLNTDV